MKTTLTALVCLLFSNCLIGAELTPEDYAAAEKYIIESSHDWAESVVTGDMSNRRVYFAEDFIGTSTSGDRYDKAAVTRDTGPATYTVSNKVNNVEVRFFGTTAVAHGDETWRKKMAAVVAMCGQMYGLIGMKSGRL